MPPTTIREAPALDSFTSLLEHQSQTPSTFFNTKPILHYHSTSVRAIGSRDHVGTLPIYSTSENNESDGESSIVELVEAFVTSENLTLFNHTKSTGVSIPYPAISLHAIQRLPDPANPAAEVQGLYMQLELSDPEQNNEDDEMDAVEVTLIPAPSEGETSSIQALFDAVSNCSNLHPDPAFQDDEEMDEDEGDSRIMFEGNVGYEGISGLPGVQQGASDGGLPPAFPGSGGWITAENVGEYFDADGNWIGGGEVEVLGDGAGRVRTRDEVDGEEQVNGNGHSVEEESKRPRTD